MTHHLAQLNVALIRHPLDHEANAEFVAALDPINELAESSPGFVWRLTDDDGQSSSYIRATDDPDYLVNLSVWESVDALEDFVYRSDHLPFLRRRREWFALPEGPHLVCWWVPAGHTPTVGEALARLESLREHGPTPDAFLLRSPFPAPTSQPTECPPEP